MKYRDPIHFVYIVFFTSYLTIFAQNNSFIRQKTPEGTHNSLKNRVGKEFIIIKDSTIYNYNKNIDVGFQLGIRDAFVFALIKYYNFNSRTYSNHFETLFVPLNLHLAAGICFGEYLKIDFRIGLIYAYTDFTGTDEGVFLEKDIFKHNIYATIGVDFFSINKEGHGSAKVGGNITSLCMGIGYHLANNLNFDIIYFYPTNKVYGYDTVHYVTYSMNYNKVNNGLLLLGFQYSFLL